MRSQSVHIIAHLLQSSFVVHRKHITRCRYQNCWQYFFHSSLKYDNEQVRGGTGVTMLNSGFKQCLTMYQPIPVYRMDDIICGLSLIHRHMYNVSLYIIQCTVEHCTCQFFFVSVSFTIYKPHFTLVLHPHSGLVISWVGQLLSLLSFLYNHHYYYFHVWSYLGWHSWVARQWRSGLTVYQKRAAIINKSTGST